MLRTPSFLQWPLCLQQPLRTSPFLYKRVFLSFVIWTLPLRLHVRNCNSLLFQNKSILLEKYLAISLRSAVWNILVAKGMRNYYIALTPLHTHTQPLTHAFFQR